MFKIQCQFWSLAATLALLVAASTASATPQTYLFTSGTVQLSAINTVTGNSVIAGVSPVAVPLGGTFVEFDPMLGANGTITDLQFVSLGSFDLDLDPVEAALDMITVNNAILINAPGAPDATAAVTGAGSFALDTEMSGDVTGVFPDTTPFGPQNFTSVTSGAVGTLTVVGPTLQLALFGVNLATFGSATDPLGNDIEVKADFFFISTLVPEPGSALLMGLGLAGLSRVRPSRKL